MPTLANLEMIYLHPQPLSGLPGRGSFSGQAVLKRVSDQLGIVFHIHLFHDARAVGADGLDARGELLGYFLEAPSGSDRRT